MSKGKDDNIPLNAHGLAGHHLDNRGVAGFDKPMGMLAWCVGHGVKGEHTWARPQ